MKMNRKIGIGSFVFLVLVLLGRFPVSLEAISQITPQAYLETIPYIELGRYLIITPSSTVLVYLLGIITILFGVLLFKKKDDKVKMLWGVTLIIWGIGTMLAGTSYQGLGFELKCRGYQFCLFTSWFELSYLFITAISITVMGYAVAEKALKDRSKEIYLNVIGVGLIVYSLSLVVGTITEIRFLITYEYFLMFFMPYFVSFLIMNIKGYKHERNEFDKGLIIVWLLMLIVNVLYFAYFFSGIPEGLYENYGVWFSANDVLHIGLIGWMGYIYWVVNKRVY